MLSSTIPLLLLSTKCALLIVVVDGVAGGEMSISEKVELLVIENMLFDIDTMVGLTLKLFSSVDVELCKYLQCSQM